MTEAQLIGLLATAVLGMVGVIYHLVDRRLKDMEQWRGNLTADLLKTREYYLKEISMTYATKESFERLEETLAGNHQENVRRLEKMDGTLTQVVEIAVILRGVKADIGDHNSGLRGQVHEQRKQLVRLAGKVPGGLEVFE